ncbi:MAG: hypothetical protein K8U57_37085 [Planctomycetes bacterium]|nr:hypothetical protein [Planctomycetota bacterium]
MNTLTALLNKLQTRKVSAETQALCGLIDAHIANLKAEIDSLKRKQVAYSDAVARQGTTILDR